MNTNFSTYLPLQFQWTGEMESTFASLIKNQFFNQSIDWQLIAKKITKIFEIDISEEFCRNKWKMNKEAYPLKRARAWTKLENQNLINLLKVYGYNWDKISQQTNRTVGSLRQHYRIFLLNTLSLEEQLQINLIKVNNYPSIQWTPEKNQQLIEHIKKNQWNIIKLSCLLNMSQDSIYKRFRKLEKENLFSQEELSKLNLHKRKTTKLITSKKKPKLKNIKDDKYFQSSPTENLFSLFQINPFKAQPIKNIHINLLNVNLPTDKIEIDSELDLLWEKVGECLPAINKH